jgi:sugar transferase (PEP-CTERM/EpsH1 system associated)
VKLVVVAPRFPFPLDKGDRLTIHHLVRHFGAKHQVWLACFLEPDQDPAWVDQLRPHCEDVLTVPLSRARAYTSTASATLGRTPLQVRYYADPRMHRLVDDLVGRVQPDLLYAHTIRMGPYTVGHTEVPRVLAMQISMTLNYRRLAQETRPPQRWLHTLEHRKLRRFEGPFANRFDTALLISPHDLRAIEHDPPRQVVFSPHGVDGQRYAPDPTTEKDPATIVFSGNMAYPPNVDAALWFHRDIWPRVRAEVPDARFQVVGADPVAEVRALASDPAVTVTGRVPDLVPHLDRATVAIDPLRVGAGLQNKVLEGMAMGLPMVITTVANEGIQATPGEHVLVADEPASFAADVVRLLEDPASRATLGTAARRHILDAWSWEHHFDDLEAVFERLVAQRR